MIQVGRCRCDYSWCREGTKGYSIYAKGHNPNTRPTFGRKLSEETKRKMSNSAKGRTLSKATKRKMSRSLKGLPSWNKGLTKVTNASLQVVSEKLTDRRFSKETLRRMSIARKGKRPSSAQRKHILEMAAKQKGVPLSAEVKHRMRLAQQKRFREKPISSKEKARLRKMRRGIVVPFRDSTIEVLTRQLLVELGVEFIQHGLLRGSWHRFDFVLPYDKIVVECDGCYWHVCNKHYPLKSKKDWRAKQLDRAHISDKFARSRGYSVVRLWEHDIRVGRFSRLLAELLFGGKKCA